MWSRPPSDPNSIQRMPSGNYGYNTNTSEYDAWVLQQQQQQQLLPSQPAYAVSGAVSTVAVPVFQQQPYAGAAVVGTPYATGYIFPPPRPTFPHQPNTQQYQHPQLQPIATGPVWPTVQPRPTRWESAAASGRSAGQGRRAPNPMYSQGHGTGGRSVLSSSGEPPMFTYRGGRGRGRGRGPATGQYHQLHQQSDALLQQVASRIKALPPGRPVAEAAVEALQGMDSRGCANLVKQLANEGAAARAWELFRWLQSQPEGSSLYALCDVFVCTAMISLCSGSSSDVDKALQLSRGMRQRGIQPNVHTFSALMNVCIKGGRNQAALDVFQEMQQEGVQPNVVTYNTLVDVYGKMGHWAEALKVLDIMKAQGLEPVTRTYNTLMIACNSSNQWQEALTVYAQMRDSGHVPNTTTYNALIGAHTRAGRLDKVMEVFQEMVAAGCERSVITYSALISACERDGQWQMALQMFDRMKAEGCQPNVITYNSLMTACTTGGQWEKAVELFEQMQRAGMQPDIVSYTALVAAYDKGGQWPKVLETYEQLQRRGLRLDHIAYTTLVDALWETGVTAGQQRSVHFYRRALEHGVLKLPAQQQDGTLEIQLLSHSAGMPVVSFFCWLYDTRRLVLQGGEESLPIRIVVRCGRSRAAELASSPLKEALQAWLAMYGSPFKLSQESNSTGFRMEASGDLIGLWLGSEALDECLELFSPAAALAVSRTQEDVALDAALAFQCQDAYALVQQFEATHCLNVAAMSGGYLQTRHELIQGMFAVGASLRIAEEVLHDSVLLMDRVMSAGTALRPDLLRMAMLCALYLTARRPSAPATAVPLLLSDLAAAAGLPVVGLQSMDATLRAALLSDLDAVSALRCLKLYLRRLGYELPVELRLLDGGKGAALAALLYQAVNDIEFLNYRPSIAAAAVLYCNRLQQGLLPLWPSVLGHMTGYSPMETPEFVAAVAAAQRLQRALAAQVSQAVL